MVVLPYTGASRYHNCCIDGGTSPGYFGYTLVCTSYSKECAASTSKVKKFYKCFYPGIWRRHATAQEWRTVTNPHPRRKQSSQLSLKLQISVETSLTLSLLMSYIYGTPCKSRNFNVVYTWTYVWQRWKPSLSICSTTFQHWINAESYPVTQLCVNTLPVTKTTLITSGI
jgi:hypothetical protein